MLPDLLLTTGNHHWPVLPSSAQMMDGRMIQLVEHARSTRIAVAVGRVTSDAQG
jgi:hypothetical protein